MLQKAQRNQLKKSRYTLKSLEIKKPGWTYAKFTKLASNVKKLSNFNKTKNTSFKTNTI